MFLPHLSDRTLARARKHGARQMKRRAAEVLRLSDPDYGRREALPSDRDDLQSEQDRLSFVRRLQKIDSGLNRGDWCSAARVIKDARVVKYNSRISKQVVPEHTFRLLKRRKGEKLSDVLVKKSKPPVSVSREMEEELAKEAADASLRYNNFRQERSKDSAGTVTDCWELIANMLSIIAAYKRSVSPMSLPFTSSFQSFFPSSPPIVNVSQFQMAIVASVKPRVTAGLTTCICAVFDYFRMLRSPKDETIDARYPLLWLAVLENQTVATRVRPDTVAANIDRLNHLRKKLHSLQKTTLPVLKRQKHRAEVAASQRDAKNIVMLRKDHASACAMVEKIEKKIFNLEQQVSDQVRVTESDEVAAKEAASKCLWATWDIMSWGMTTFPTATNMMGALQTFNSAVTYDMIFACAPDKVVPDKCIDYQTAKIITSIKNVSTDLAFCLTQSMWGAASDTLRAIDLECRLRKAQHNFVEAFKPMKRNILLLMYRFSKLKRAWMFWCRYRNMMVTRKNAIRGVHHYRMRKALRHFHKRIVSLAKSRKFFREQQSLTDTWYLRLMYHRWRRIASRMHSHKIASIQRVENILFRRIGMRNCFCWWHDVMEEEKGIAIAKIYNNTVVKRGWLRRLHNYTRRCVADRRISEIRNAIRLAEDEERKITDAEASTFFLTEREREERQKRVQEKIKQDEEDRYNEYWEKQRRKADQIVIKIKQAKERVIHKEKSAIEEEHARSSTWDTLADSVLVPSIRARVNKYCKSPQGKIFIKNMATELKQMRLSECQRLLRYGTLNPEGCDWVAVNEIKGVYNSSVAWLCTSDNRSVKHSKLGFKTAKEIAMARYLAEEINKAKKGLEEHRRQADENHAEIKAALLVQSIYRMKQHRKKAMVIFQARYVSMLDVYGGHMVWYNLVSRKYADEKPLFLYPRDRVTSFSIYQARGPDEASGLYWYEYRPPPYRLDNEPQSISWAPPDGLLLCQRCQVCICRRRCRGDSCVNDRSSPLYLCFYCYDEIHPSEDTGDPNIDIHRLHDHDNFVTPTPDDFVCSICQTTTADMFCRDGDCKGALFCSACWSAVHSHGEMAWHNGDRFDSVGS